MNILLVYVNGNQHQYATLGRWFRGFKGELQIQGVPIIMGIQ